jgi:hypothetical protein
MVLLRHYVWVGKRAWIRTCKYQTFDFVCYSVLTMTLDHPNMMCIALAFVLPQTYCELPQPHVSNLF